MGISRRLILVNSVYSAVPTFYMCSLKVPIEILDQIDKYRKHVLWHGGDVTKKGGYLVAWTTACRSKEGGLSIIDLRTQNTTLLLKFWICLGYSLHGKVYMRMVLHLMLERGLVLSSGVMLCFCLIISSCLPLVRLTKETQCLCGMIFGILESQNGVFSSFSFSPGRNPCQYNNVWNGTLAGFLGCLFRNKLPVN